MLLFYSNDSRFLRTVDRALKHILFYFKGQFIFIIHFRFSLHMFYTCSLSAVLSNPLLISISKRFLSVTMTIIKCFINNESLNMTYIFVVVDGNNLLITAAIGNLSFEYHLKLLGIMGNFKFAAILNFFLSFSLFMLQLSLISPDW